MTTLALEGLDTLFRQIEDGTIRIRDTRIPLERVIDSYLNGNAPSTIVRQYDTLDLADVYAVIGYYTTHREEVDEYRRRQEEDAAEIQRRIEAAQPPRDVLREKLLACRARM